MATDNTKTTGPQSDGTWSTMCDPNGRVWRDQEEEELRGMKIAAAEYFRVNGIPEQMETVLIQLFLRQPEDLHGYLANYFMNESAPAKLSRLEGREVYDARGRPSIQAEVFCIIRNQEESVSSAAVSSHFGPRDVNLAERADHVETSLHWIQSLDPILTGQSPCDQAEVDHILSSFFMARYLEDQEIQSTKKQPSCSPSVESFTVPPTPPPSSTKEKKNSSKGKKGGVPDKPIPPPEPSVPVLPGSLAIGSVSLAVAKAGAQTQGLPLYKYISQLKNKQTPSQMHIPVSLVTLMSCGLTSPGKLNLLEEIILVPKAGQRVRQIITTTLVLQTEMMRIMESSAKAGGEPMTMLGDTGAPALGFERAEQPLDLISEACSNLGLELGTEIRLVLNCAAPDLMDYSKGKYEVASRVFVSPDELVDMYQSLISKYPAAVALIDPLRREDTEQWEMLNTLIGDSCVLLSDITYKPQGTSPPGVKGRILKHINEVSVSELVKISSQEPGSLLMGTAYSQPCSEDSLPDVAVGLGLDYIKLGGLSGSERMSKYNRLISIEDQLDQQGVLVIQETSPSPLLPDQSPESACDG